MSPTNSQRRYTTPIGLRKLLTTNEDNIRSWPAIDAFHEPYPTSWNDLAIDKINSKRDTETPRRPATRSREDESCEYLEVPSAFPQDPEGKARDDTKLHLPLPYELVEQVFHYLSVPALDAARFTCRSWWTMIMTSRALLLSATGLEASSNIRRLAAAFDETTNLSATYLHPDSWRVRFRVNTVNISLPSGHHPQRVIQAAAMTCKGNLSAVYSVIITTNHDFRSTEGIGMLTFYHLSARGPPACVGSFSVPYKEGPMELSALAETEPEGSWVISVRMTHHSQLYALIPKHGFGESESPYIIRTMGPEHFRLHAGSLYRSLPRIMAPQNDTDDLVDSRKWRLLTSISPNKESDVLYIPRLRWPPGTTRELSDREAVNLRVKGYLEGQQSCFIAESLDTRDLCVVSRDRDPCKPPTEHHVRTDHYDSISYQNRAVLLSPAGFEIYTNVTVSGPLSINPAQELIVMIAVIWKILYPPHTTILCIYELPVAFLTGRSEPSPPQPLQGRRLMSLPHPFYGGIHPRGSPFASLPHQRPSQNPLLHHKTILLSGISFNSPGTDHKATTWTPSCPQLYVWGPAHISDQPTEITVRTLDLSFSDARNLPVSDGQLNPVPAKRRIDDVCACRLHDKGWNVILPPVSNITGSGSLEWVKGFWGLMIPKSCFNKPDFSGGTTQADSDRRRAALARLENWKRARVVRMKRAGLTDWEVKDKWCHASWSDYGKVGRPRGWEREWRGWQREMEMQLGPLGDAVPSEYQPSAARKPEFRFSISTTNRSSWIPRWLF